MSGSSFSRSRRLKSVLRTFSVAAFITAALFTPSGVPSVLASHSPQRQLAENLDDTALVVRARVLDVDPAAYDFDTREALTHVSLDILETLFGDASKRRVEFFVRGGLKPDGGYRRYSGVPRFTVGSTYLIMLRHGSWHLAPVTNLEHGVFREEDRDGRQVFVNQQGKAVKGLFEGLVTVTDHRVGQPELRPQEARGDALRETNKSVDDAAEKAALAEATERRAFIAELKKQIAEYTKQLRSGERVAASLESRSMNTRPLPIELSPATAEVTQ